ncbi:MULTISPECIES: nucleoside-diphosphate kinase [Thermaerobacter]|uniref:Nucleoside diphosphate kinase n=1 Tax=Thermaerobacter subterraneus DSM 13965 TaxID=867903 RepID=K6NYE6_9FIRM|nr:MULTISPECIES: nucleoside-diphosphate kinase [Thermaerobacter]EKP93905.1 nucleoside diphosphate kinase [Thermaerobacter subterraneus DSM 13965]QIA27039.1 nucleoside-diphosphate kinase [Thermaerobacter sp. PB12/4term]
MERTFVMVKPDGVQRGLVGEIIARLERKGLKLVGLKMVQVSEELARRHYAAHEGKPFFPGLIRFITSAPVVAMVWEGREAVNVVRNLMGPTDGAKAAPGTIRGDLANDIGFNLVHGSDSLESARQEIELWFRQDELIDWENHREAWLYDRS